MTPSEENVTAWIDGRFSGEEAARFERSLGAALPGLLKEREETLKLGSLLRAHGRKAAPEKPLPNADFFNHQLLERIEAESRKASPAPAFSAWRIPFWRLLVSGALCSAIAAMASISILQPVGKPEPGYYAKVLNPKPGSRRISASTFYSKKEKVTVLWLEGLEKVPVEANP